MNDNVEGLAERLEAYQEALSEVNPNARTFAEAASTIRALAAENERLREDLATRAMNWAKNNLDDKGEILRAEIKAATADAKLREALDVMRAVLPAVRKAGFVSSAQVLEAFLTDMEEP